MLKSLPGASFSTLPVKHDLESQPVLESTSSAAVAPEGLHIGGRGPNAMRPAKGSMSALRSCLPRMWSDEERREDWAAQAPPDEADARRETLARIRALKYRRYQSVSLTLDNLGLTSLPPLPAKVTHLRISDNRLTELPRLPPHLQQLYASNNLLARLPSLPQPLDTLNVSNNRLTRLPALPGDTGMTACLHPQTTGLQRLDVSNNNLKSLPRMPDSMMVLRAENNQGTFSHYDYYQQISDANAVVRQRQSSNGPNRFAGQRRAKSDF